MRHSIPWEADPYFGKEPVPLLDVLLRMKDSTIEGFSFLIDSGADISMAPSWLCEDLGRDWSSGSYVRLRGISQKDECDVEGRILSIEMHIPDVQRRLVIPVCFAEGDCAFVLGRQRFFDAFRITFDQLSLKTEIETR